MKHQNTLFITTTVKEDARLYSYKTTPDFNIILIIKKENYTWHEIKEETKEIKLKYLDANIPISDCLYTTQEQPIQILKEIKKSEEFKLITSIDNSYYSFWFEGVSSTISDVNCIFRNVKENKWLYAHPGTENVTDPDLFFLNNSSYLEYERISENKDPYTYAPFVPLIAPVYHSKVWHVIDNLLSKYEYNSERAFTQYWIPEALSRQEKLIHPIILKQFLIDFEEPSYIYKDIDFKKAKLSCYAQIDRLYPLNLCIEAQCISLPDSQSDNRKKQFQQYADLHGLEFEFWPAVDGRQWTRADYPDCIAHRGRRVDWYEPLKPGEVGTVLSHKHLIQEAWDKGLAGLAIFEDDGILVKPLDCIQIPEDADYLMLNGRFIHNQKGEAVIGSCGTEACVVTRRGMYKMLQILEHIDMPIDLIMLAHANSVIKSQASLSTVRNRLNPTLNIYHNKVYCLNGDHGMSTFDR